MAGRKAILDYLQSIKLSSSTVLKDKKGLCILCLGHNKLLFTFPQQSCPMCVNVVDNADEIKMICTYCNHFFKIGESVFPTHGVLGATKQQTFRFCSTTCLGAHNVVNALEADDTKNPTAAATSTEVRKHR
jgi:hypothetical protein